MAAYRRVYDSRHLQADSQEMGSAPELYAQQSSTGYLYLFLQTSFTNLKNMFNHNKHRVTLPFAETSVSNFSLRSKSET